MRKLVLHERTGRLAWEDLRTILAVAREGSLAGAARSLDVRHSTIFRRLDEAERRLGVSLFERTPRGWVPNAEGEAVAEAARAMEEAALAAERRIQGSDASLTGTIRMATSELLSGYLLPPVLGGFLAAHPAIEIEVDVSNRNLDLTRREADLAVRATLNPPDALIGRRVATFEYAVYGAHALAKGSRKALDLATLSWIGFDERVAHLEIARWQRAALPDVHTRLRIDSLAVMLQFAAEGLGVAALPIFAAAQDPRLVRISEPIGGPRMDLWVLTHPDVRRNARVHALAAHLAKEIPARLANLLEQGPCTPHMADCPRIRGLPRKARAARL